MWTNYHIEALPEILELTHRRAIVTALGERGVSLAEQTWEQIDRARVEEKLGHVTNNLVYIDSTPIGPIFGKMYTLKESGPTDEQNARLANGEIGFGTNHNIRLHTSIDVPHIVRLVLTASLPPVAVDERVFAGIPPKINGEGWIEFNDEATLGAILNEYGDNAIEFINDEVAATVITALQQSHHSVDIIR